MNMIYLDYNATTPLDPRVAETMKPFLSGQFGNPSSSHEFGIEARRTVEEARQKVADLLNAFPDEIIFTGGGTEANNLAIKGYAFAHAGKGKHIITSAVEHPAVTEVCEFLANMGFRLTLLPVNGTGTVDPDDLQKAISRETILVSIMHANNETGAIQPTEAIGKICREHDIIFHCDAAQSIGKIPVDVKKMYADFLSVAAHKFYAPKGVGALFCRRGTSLWKMMHGADHEQGKRAGTENVMGIAGLGKAAELVLQEAGSGLPDAVLSIQEAGSRRQDARCRMQDRRDMLHQGILEAFPDARLNGPKELRLPNTLSLGFKDKDAAVLLNQWRGIAASAGAACHAGQETISRVLLAMQVPRDYALGTVRFSTGKMTTEDEIVRAIEIISGKVRMSSIGSVRDYTPGSLESVNETARPSADRITEAEHETARNETARPSADRITEADPGVDGNETGTSSADNRNEIKLTRYTHSLGCACKIRPRDLEEILGALPKPKGNNILVGTETRDDAAVVELRPGLAIVQTVDFIPPVADDPYEYGAIAAANALSDIWAMGAKPLFALSVLAFPRNLLSFGTLEKILKGASDKAAEAGISIIGGHSIEDEEPKFGLVVSGEVSPDKVWRNSTPQLNDVLILTKPLGTGIISTAVKRGYASREAAAAASDSMQALNMGAAEILMGFDVHACTDVTGFGLLGHLKEMLQGNLDADIYWKQIPFLPMAMEYVLAGFVPGGTLSNLEYLEGSLDVASSVPGFAKILLADAQTSGGLLVAMPQQQLEEAREAFSSKGIPAFSVIGQIVKGSSRIRVS